MEKEATTITTNTENHQPSQDQPTQYHFEKPLLYAIQPKTVSSRNHIKKALIDVCVMQTNNKIRASFNQQINESVQWTRPIAAVNSPERKKHEKGSNTKLSTWNSNHWILKVNFCLCFKCILEVSMIVEPRPETPTLFPVNFMDHFSFKTVQKDQQFYSGFKLASIINSYI